MLLFLKHLFLPHHTNNHRAKILHPTGLILLLAIFLALESALAAFSKIRPDVLGFATDISVQRLLESTNQKRMANGLSPLILSGELNQAAAGKASDMFSKNYWAHISPSGKTPWDFILGANYHYIYAGENLAKDFQDADGVVEAWMNSPSHKENLLNSKYQEVGFAVVNGSLEGEETTLVVQMFGARSQNEDAKNISAPTPTPFMVSITPTPSSPEENKEAAKTPMILSNGNGNNPPSSEIKPEFKSTKDVVVKNTPKFDFLSLSKKFTSVFIIFLISVLIVDAIVISKKKIVRISGDNLAHILILVCLLAAVLVVGRGSVT